MHFIKHDVWKKTVVSLLNREIDSCLCSNKQCNLFLTGGNTAKDLYKEWSSTSSFKQLNNVNFYLGDERFVSPMSKYSNSRMINESLFSDGIPGNCKFLSIKTDYKDLSMCALEYEKILLNQRIDIIIFSMGLDGHIASIFPQSKELKENKKLVIETESPSFPHHRITITPKLIKKSSFNILLAIGKEKKILIEKLSSVDDNSNEVPVYLIDKSHWYVAY
jgi:6-phosphogluconolactonase